MAEKGDKKNGMLTISSFALINLQNQWGTRDTSLLAEAHRWGCCE